jgi:hypothetical protein
MSSISPFSEPLPSPPLQTVTAAMPAPVKPKSKPRKRVNTAEKRHQHNAIERARRESLNNKFLTLARLLPSLANHRRPSKSAIVNGSIGHVTKARDQRLLAATLLKELCKERDELFEEVNEWRRAGGVARKEGSPQAWNDEMEQVCSVETEVFGNFASMGGDDDGEDEAEASEPVFAMPSTNSNGNGLFTPRDSTDIDPMTMFAQPQRSSAASTNFQAMNWSQEFTNQFAVPVNHQNPTPSMSNSTPLPFSAFMSDSTDSPSTSQLGNSIMLTPPTTADPISLYTHTPSPPAPRPSSASIDVKPTLPLPLPQRQNSAQPWTPQQLLFLQQIQQHQAQVRQHQQNLANHYTSFPANVATSNSNPAEGFTQSLIATMFPQQAHVAPAPPRSNVNMGMNMNTNMNMNAPQGGNGDMEQVQQWRKAALTSFLQQHGHANAQLPMRDMPSVSPYQQPMLTPLLNMNGNGWSPENVEGF